MKPTTIEEVNRETSTAYQLPKPIETNSVAAIAFVIPKILHDCQQDAEEYLMETEVPFGGE